MPRRKRSYQPGGAFHITARTNGKEHWLDDSVRDALVDIIATSIARTDARLIAFAIMSNHFHLVLWQGFMTLGQVVQPITRRLALLLARKLGRGGRLLERRYYNVQCVDAEHLREAIVYTHLNPVAAGLCERSEDYRWSSQRAYSGGDLHVLMPRLAVELELFGASDARTRELLQRDYLRYENWRVICRATPEGQPRPLPPIVLGGDSYWMNSIAARGSAALGGRASTPADLRDVIRSAVAQLAPDMPIDLVCSGNRGSKVVEVRRAAIQRAVKAGYSVSKIARHIRLSETTISRVARTTSGRPPVLFR